MEMHWFGGNQIPDSIEKFEIDGDERNNTNEDDVNVDDSESEMKKVMTTLMILKFKLV